MSTSTLAEEGHEERSQIQNVLIKTGAYNEKKKKKSLYKNIHVSAARKVCQDRKKQQSIVRLSQREFKSVCVLLEIFTVTRLYRRMEILQKIATSYILRDTQISDNLESTHNFSKLSRSIPHAALFQIRHKLTHSILRLPKRASSLITNQAEPGLIPQNPIADKDLNFTKDLGYDQSDEHYRLFTKLEEIFYFSLPQIMLNQHSLRRHHLVRDSDLI